MKNNAKLSITPQGEALLKAVAKKGKKAKRKKRYMIDARKVEILAHTLIRWNIGICGLGTPWICQGCGVKGKQPLLLKHKPECLYVAHYKAVDLLNKALQGRGE